MTDPLVVFHFDDSLFVSAGIQQSPPMYETRASAGADLSTPHDIALEPFQRVVVRTGLYIREMPMNMCAQIWPRSGLGVKCGIDKQAGLIDADYRGEIMVCLINHDPVNTFHAKAGDRIAQLVVTYNLASLTNLGTRDVERGAGGFGSTGN